jgi:LysM repeat protein
VLLICLLVGGCYRPAPTAESKEEVTTEEAVPAGETAGETAGGSGNGKPAFSSAAATVTAVARRPDVTPSAAYPGIYSGTPTPNPTPSDYGARPAVDSYKVKPGETLSLIASIYGCTVEEIVVANNLVSADSISAGQTLHIPTQATEVGPALKLVPNSELVYGPSSVGFDVERFVARHGGYLDDYAEQVEGELRSGAQIVQLVAQRFSVGPRVLLALLEMQSGWVTRIQPRGSTAYPLGHVEAYQEGLFHQLSWAAVRLNQGYYGWRRGDRRTVHLMNGTRIGLAPQLNAGTVGVQNCLAELAMGKGAWVEKVGRGGFLSAYERLFGNPFGYTVEPLVPEGLAQPELRLPWEAGETWYYTGGPHGGWGTGSGRAALDFVPGGKQYGCTPAPDWVTAAAPGLVLRSENGEVIVDLDGDGFEQTGWILLYMHVHNEGRVEEGEWLEQGQRIGHPSCEGGYSEATHVHIARRYNGEWIPAGSGPCPMVLSGWTAQEATAEYDGAMVRGGETRYARELWDDEINGLVSDNEAP